MQVGQIIRRITDEGRTQIASIANEPAASLTEPESPQPEIPQDSGFVVEAETEGGQLLDVDRLLEALPDQTTCKLRAFVGGSSRRTPRFVSSTPHRTRMARMP